MRVKSESEVAQLCPTLCDPIDYIQSMEFSRPEYWNTFPSPGDLPNPGIEPRSPASQVDSLPSESQRKSKSTRGGSLSLLQGIFPTQRWNQDLLHCRWILYQLSYQGSPSHTCPSYYIQISSDHFSFPENFSAVASLAISFSFFLKNYFKNPQTV